MIDSLIHCSFVQKKRKDPYNIIVHIGGTDPLTHPLFNVQPFVAIPERQAGTALLVRNKCIMYGSRANKEKAKRNSQTRNEMSLKRVPGT